LEEAALNLAVPQMLWLLAILPPALVLFFWWAWRKRQQLVTQFISARLLGHLKVGVSPSRQKARMALMVLAVVLLILALARPQWGVTNQEARQRGLDIIVAIDTSNSMLAEDVSPNRLARAKLAALDLARKARTDRLGLIAFAGAAFLQCPLTLDDAAFASSVQALDTKTISEAGTAIEEAIDEARKAFKDEPDNCKVLILFTDGEDHEGEPVAAAQKAAKEGMIIFTVGIGTTEGELLRVKDERGRLDYIRDDEGKPVKSHLDEDLLQQIALATPKGSYQRLTGANTIDLLYDRGIAPLPKTDRVTKSFQNFHERYHWPLAIAMLLLLLEMFLPDRKRRRSQQAAAAAPQGALAETTALLLLLALPAVAAASPSSALREYNSGKYEESFKDYGKLLERKQDDPRLKFNTGAAAYQSKQLDDAAKLFTDSLGSPDLNLQQRAYYNLGNTMYRLGQNLSDPKKKQESWENAVKGFESALKLNQQDADAKYNLDFVNQQLEELKKEQQQQQQQQQQDQKNKPDNNSDKKQDQKPQENQKKQQQENKDQSKSGSDSQKQDKQDQNQQPDKPKDDKSQSKLQKQDSQEKKQQPQPQQPDQQKQQSKEEAEQEAAAMAAGQMTPQQAQQLLDSLKDEDKVFQPAFTKRQNSPARNRKNW
jgi:Ca-activated chloride channel family protein